MNKRYAIAAVGLALCVALSGCGGEAEENVITETTTGLVETTTEPTTAPQGQTPSQTEKAPDNTLMLVSTAEPVAEMTALKRDVYDNGSYYYMDTTEDGSLRSISSCYVTTIREGESEEDYATRRALGLATTITPGVPYQLSVVQEQALTDAIGYPVYLVAYFTGSDEKASCWTVYLFRTEHYSYQYAFVTGAVEGLEMESEFVEYFSGMKLEAMDA